MEDRAQQPQKCLGKHLHGRLLSGIQNDFIRKEMRKEVVYFTYSDCAGRRRSSQFPAEHLVLVLD